MGVPYISHIDKHIGVRLFSVDQESVITQALPIMYDWVCKNQPLLSSLIARLELVMRYNKIMYKIHVRKIGEIMSENKEMVNHPSHYGGEDNPYEAIKVIEAWDLDFCLGNVVKYISRAGKKNKECLLEDLEKAAWYLNREISNMKSFKGVKEN